MNTPFFSIIIPTYNRAHILPNTISSVQSQTFSNWELIIVDDGSTDNTEEVVQDIIAKDARVNYFYQENRERSAARNNGASKSNGDYLLFLDSDDYYLPNHLKLLERYLIAADLPTALIFTGFQILENQEITNGNTPAITNNIVKYFFDNPIIPARVSIHKQIFQDFQFNEAITLVEDSILWSEISTKYPILYSEQDTVIYHLHDDNSVNIKNYHGLQKLRGIKWFFKTRASDTLSNSYKKEMISNCHYRIALSHESHGKAIKCIMSAFRSILIYPKSDLTKSKIFLIMSQIPGFQFLWNRSAHS